MLKIKGIIFDMDGVLIDACEWHYTALNQALELFGFTISRDAHLNVYDGLPTREKLKLLSYSTDFPTSLHPFINNLKQNYTLNLASQHCRPRATHQHALSTLKKMNYRLAVASNSVRNSIDLMLRQAKIHQYFEFILSNEDVSKGKPSPEIYCKTFSLFGLKPEECVVVEDNPHGIAAAEAAGAHVLHVKDPSSVNLSRIISFIRNCERDLDNQ